MEVTSGSDHLEYKHLWLSTLTIDEKVFWNTGDEYWGMQNVVELSTEVLLSIFSSS